MILSRKKKNDGFGLKLWFSSFILLLIELEFELINVLINYYYHPFFWIKRLAPMSWSCGFSLILSFFGIFCYCCLSFVSVFANLQIGLCCLKWINSTFPHSFYCYIWFTTVCCQRKSLGILFLILFSLLDEIYVFYKIRNAWILCNSITKRALLLAILVERLSEVTRGA